MAAGRSTRQRLDDFIYHHQQCGHIREGHVEICSHEDAIRISLRCTNGESLGYTFTNHEARMGGDEALQHWVRTIEQELMRRNFRNWEGQQRPDPRTAYQPCYITACVSSGFITSIVGGGRLAWGSEDPIAIKKAKDLFKLACGKKAFDTLEAGNGLAITGSAGTEYRLHKRASFCVERVSDGAQLCAVVPGVPLYDHLLGIKLMVENDEKKFLKTANVSGGNGRRIANGSFAGAVRNAVGWI